MAALSPRTGLIVPAAQSNLRWDCASSQSQRPQLRDLPPRRLRANNDAMDGLGHSGLFLYGVSKPLAWQGRHSGLFEGGNPFRPLLLDTPKLAPTPGGPNSVVRSEYWTLKPTKDKAC